MLVGVEQFADPRDLGIGKVFPQNLAERTVSLREQAFGSVLVSFVRIERSFRNVGKRSVPDVVEQSGNLHMPFGLSAQDGLEARMLLVASGEDLKDAMGGVKNAKTVGESSVFGPVVSQRAQAELPDPTEPLEFWCGDEVENEFTILIDRDQSMNGVANDFTLSVGHDE